MLKENDILNKDVLLTAQGFSRGSIILNGNDYVFRDSFRPPFPLQQLNVGGGVSQVFEGGNTGVVDSEVEGRVSCTDWIAA